MPTRQIYLPVVFGLAALVGQAAAQAPDAKFVSAAGPPCPPEQIVYQDVVCHRCKLVPDTKQIKKTVYEVKEVPFCLKKLPPLLGHHSDCCDCAMCAECSCPRYKKVLVKKEIVCQEICTSKCIIEEYIERVPCKVCAPCPQYTASDAGATGQPAMVSGFQPLLPSPPPVLTR
jgi:hypothetical protein